MPEVDLDYYTKRREERARAPVTPAPQDVSSSTDENAVPIDYYSKRNAARRPPAPTPAPTAADIGMAFGRGAVKGLPNLAEFALDIAGNPLGVKELGATADDPATAIEFDKFITEKLGAPDPKLPNGYDPAALREAWGEFSQTHKVRLPKNKSAGAVFREGLKTVGADPNTWFPEEDTPQERIASMAGEGAIQMVLPGNKATGAAKLGRAIGDIVIGAIGGGSAQAAMEVAPDEYKPLAGLAGATIGGLGAMGVVGGVSASAKRGYEAVRPAITTEKNIESMAAEQLGDVVGDSRQQVIDTLNEPRVNASGAPETAAQASGNVQLHSLERAMARSGDDAFKAALLEQRETQARMQREAFDNIQAEGAPTSVADYLNARTRELEDQASALQTAAKQVRDREAEALGDPEVAEVGKRGREAINERLKELDKETDDLWKSIPKNTQVVTPPIIRASDRIYGKMTPEDRLSLLPIERDIADIIKSYGPTLAFDRFASLRSEISGAMRAARSPLQPNNKAFGRLSQLRGAVEEAVADSVAAKVAEDNAAVAAGTMTPEETITAKFLQAAREFNAERQGKAGTATAASDAGTTTGGSTAVSGADGTAIQDGGGPTGPARPQGLSEDAGGTPEAARGLGWRTVEDVNGTPVEVRTVSPGMGDTPDLVVDRNNQSYGLNKSTGRLDTPVRAIGQMPNERDRYVGGLSIQQSLETQGRDFVPTDPDMAALESRLSKAAGKGAAPGVGTSVKALSTEGRYGGIERSVDLEVNSSHYNPQPLWRQMLQEARDAKQDSVFLAREVQGHRLDPLRHRPAIELTFDTPVGREALDAELQKLANNGVEFLTVTTGQRAGTVKGAMPNATGVRVIYMPEFERRYGFAAEDLSALDDAGLTAHMRGKADEMNDLIATVSANVPGVRGRVAWYDTDVAFGSEYGERLGQTGGTEASSRPAGGKAWRGQSVREGLAAADRHVQRTEAANGVRPDEPGAAAAGQAAEGSAAPVDHLRLRDTGPTPGHLIGQLFDMAGGGAYGLERASKLEPFRDRLRTLLNDPAIQDKAQAPRFFREAEKIMREAGYKGTVQLDRTSAVAGKTRPTDYVFYTDDEFRQDFPSARDRTNTFSAGEQAPFTPEPQVAASGEPVPGKRVLREQDAQELMKLADAGDIAGIKASPQLADVTAQMRSIPETHKVEDFASEGWVTNREYRAEGKPLKGAGPAINHLIKNARTLAATELGIKPYKIARDRKAVIVIGPPAAGKSTIANPMALELRAAIPDADEAKKIMPEYQGGIGASATHEESSLLSEAVLHELVQNGDNLVIPKVGGKFGSVEKTVKQLQDAGYTVDVALMDVPPVEAFRRMIGRFVRTGRLIPPNYFDDIAPAPAKVFDELKQKGSQNGLYRIQSERGSLPRVSEASGKNLGYQVGDEISFGGENGAKLDRPGGNRGPNEGLVGSGDSNLLDAEGAERLKRATAGTKYIKETYTGKQAQPVSGMLKRSGSRAPYDMPDEAVAGALWRKGPAGATAVQRVLKAAGDAPKAREAIEQSAVASLRREAFKDGALDLKKFETWRSAHGDALKAAGLDKRFDSLKQATEAMVDIGQRQKGAMDRLQKSAIAKVMKLDNDADIAATVGTMLNKTTSVRDIRELVGAVRNNPEALAGLRRAALDYMFNRLTNTKDGISAAQFLRFLGRNTPALSHIFSPEQMNSLRALAQELKRTSKDVRAPGGGSDTIENLMGQKRYAKEKPTTLGKLAWDMLVGGAGAATGYLHSPTLSAIVGAASALGTHALQAGRARGLRRVHELVQEAILDPELMKALLAKAPNKANTGSHITLANRLLKLGTVAAAASAGAE